MFSAPQPRSQLYTTTQAYGKGVVAALFGHGYLGSGVEKLERALEEYYPGYRAIVVPMARVGIYLTLKHLIRKGQKVILSPYTIAEVVNMVLCAGGVPLFADIEKEGSCNIDANEVAALLETEKDVGAVLVTHYYGLMCDITRIGDICTQKGIPVIEDAAQGFGIKLVGRAAGTFGRAGIFSFGLLKNVTGFVGGAVITQDAALEAQIRAEVARFRALPRDMLLKRMAKGAAFDIATNPLVFDTGVYWLFRYAYLHGIEFFKNQLDTDANPVCYSTFPEKYAYQMSSVQADIIRTQLPHCEEESKIRIAKARLYYEGLKDVAGLVLPPQRNDGSHIYLYYAVQCDDRDALGRWMTRHMRDVQISHHRNCASMPCFAAFTRDCPNAERAARSVVYLPTYPRYRDEQVAANIDVIRAFFRTRA